MTCSRRAIYAIGDIHGRLDLLEGALKTIASDDAPPSKTLVFLGDYIDRGPDSNGVLERLIMLRDEAEDDLIFLRGNHEQVLLDLLDGRRPRARWLDYGGRETLASYGAPTPTEAVADLSALITAAIPPKHIAFLRDTILTARLGAYRFAHAGLRPDRMIEEQSAEDLLWLRYYDDAAPVHQEIVVHGHCPNPLPVEGRHRIGIDTEAYASDQLTVLRLVGAERTFIKVATERAGGVGVWPAVDAAYRTRPRTTPATAAPARRGSLGQSVTDFFRGVLPGRERPAGHSRTTRDYAS